MCSEDKQKCLRLPTSNSGLSLCSAIISGVRLTHLACSSSYKIIQIHFKVLALVRGMWLWSGLMHWTLPQTRHWISSAFSCWQTREERLEPGRGVTEVTVRVRLRGRRPLVAWVVPCLEAGSILEWSGLRGVDVGDKITLDGIGSLLSLM